MNSQQQAFLQHIGTLIPKLFDAIRLGNVKSEYVLGDRIIGQRQVRLKLVVEVVDPGNNPLATHSQMRQKQLQTRENAKQSGQTIPLNPSSQSNQISSANQSDSVNQPTLSSQAKPASSRRRPR